MQVTFRQKNHHRCSVIVVAASVVWLVVTIFSDITESNSSLFLRTIPVRGRVFAVLATLLICVLPMLLSILLVERARHARTLRNDGRGGGFNR